MKKILFYIPAIIFTFFYGIAVLSGFAISTLVAVWLFLWFTSGFLLNKNYFWGSLLGALPGIHLIYMGTRETGQVFSETPIGIVILAFYVICGYLVYRKNTRLSNKS